MILVDTNLLIYAGATSAPEHERARAWLDGQFTSGVTVGLPWHSLLGFVRLTSKASLFPRPASVPQAWAHVRRWLNVDGVWIPQPTDRHADVLDSLFASTSVGSSAVMDAHLAALAIEHGLMLCSADAGFSRYPNLRWMNPLAE